MSLASFLIFADLRKLAKDHKNYSSTASMEGTNKAILPSIYKQNITINLQTKYYHQFTNKNITNVPPIYKNNIPINLLTNL